MDLLQKIKRKVKERLRNIRTLSALIREEAKYPGRPQPHMAARNPMWGGEENPTEARTGSPTANPNASMPPKPKVEPSDNVEEDQDFWYLRGDNEGWSDPNPGKKA